jgi:NADPH-dependent ferric siderophore reductase
MGFKNKAISVLEKQLTKQALILDVRAWEANTFFEVDLHIPNADFTQAKGAAHLKCRVGPLTFRDYTISAWDAGTKTCTLFIDAGHDGAGSRWVKTIDKTNDLTYLKMETRSYPLLQQGKYLFLGDQSAIGHFIALKQLAGKNEYITGALIIPDGNHRRQLKYYYPDLCLQPIPLQGTHSQTMTAWVKSQTVIGYDGVWLAGNQNMVIETRRHLKQRGMPAQLIKAEAFWK